ncbi:non-hemolytic enterotoxin subunit C [Bacillus cereus]|uniref:non-hemolytic enterotoxin subunit C n=1 Tax=Bacillus cereus TaxID=1396 RepID=UPI000BF38BEC|nr:HBL/NHE enterotoxin family protein [Bacillus cereus]PFN14776.1 enterotoxin C [Bacillus cereus]
MLKQFYKKIYMSIAILGLMLSYVMPLHVFAQEQNIQRQQSNEKYALGAEGFRDEVGHNGSSILVMDSYAQIILSNQHEIDFKGVSSISKELQTNIVIHQQVARNNAAYWLEDIRPNMLQTAQDIVDYNTIFQGSYSTMVDAIKQKDNEKLKTELKKLYTMILDNQNKSDVLLNTLISFRNKMTVDTQHYKIDVEDVSAILAEHETSIPLLKQQIEYYNDIIRTNNDTILYGEILCAIGLWIIGGPMIDVAMDEIASAEKEMQKLMSQISGIQDESVCLTNIKNKASYLTSTIDVAIDSLQNISDRWHTIGAKYNSLLQNLYSIDPNEWTFIKEDLNTAKDSWQNLSDYASELNKGIHEVEKN